MSQQSWSAPDKSKVDLSELDVQILDLTQEAVIKAREPRWSLAHWGSQMRKLQISSSTEQIGRESTSRLKVKILKKDMQVFPFGHH